MIDIKNDESFLEYIEEIEMALKNNLYLAALTMALTIPDICGKAEDYANINENSSHKSKVGNRYIKWYDENVFKLKENRDEEIDKVGNIFPRLTGKVVYNLRNMMLHQGTPSLNYSDSSQGRNKIHSFILIKESESKFGIYSSSRGIHVSNDGTVTNEVKINIRELCLDICGAARAFYKQGVYDFSFISYQILDFNKIENELDTPVTDEEINYVLEQLKNNKRNSV